MNEMIERVSQAIHDRFFEITDNGNPSIRETRAVVRLVIEALLQMIDEELK